MTSENRCSRNVYILLANPKISALTVHGFWAHTFFCRKCDPCFYIVCFSYIKTKHYGQELKTVIAAQIKNILYGKQAERFLFLAYSFHAIKKKEVKWLPFSNGRDDWIRTSGPLLPKQMRYQTALRPEIFLSFYVLLACDNTEVVTTVSRPGLFVRTFNNWFFFVKWDSIDLFLTLDLHSFS